MSAFRTLDDVDVKGKRVLLRVDLNVPMENGKVTDLTRIERVAPTVTELAGKGAKVVLLAHFGRPKGRDPKESLKPVAAVVSQVIKHPVAFAEDCIGEPAAKAIAGMKYGDVLCLENTRFHPEEEKNDKGFVDELAKLGDIFVNDAFSAAHRAHASTEGLGHKLPERVTGSDGVPLIAERAAKEGWRLFFLGAAPGVAAEAAKRLTACYPGLQVVGTYSGSPSGAEEDEIVARINQSGADILFVAYGAPAQDKWIARNLPRLRPRVAMGVGGSFDFVAGVLKRAPPWMRPPGSNGCTG
jgi:exopolysaccharide biosynthesis WecB/TagA/CpsF family protein